LLAALVARNLLKQIDDKREFASTFTTTEKQHCLSILLKVLEETNPSRMPSQVAQVLARLDIFNFDPTHDTLNRLYQMLESDSNSAKCGAMIALGYIAEETTWPAGEHGLERVVPLIVSHLTNAELGPHAATALRGILTAGFCFTRLSESDKRGLVTTVCEAVAQSTAEELRISACECLGILLSHEYQTVASTSQLINLVIETTKRAVERVDEAEPVKLQAIEVWSQLADTEIELKESEESHGRGRSHRVLEQNFEKIVPCLCHCLLKQEDVDEDDDAWTVYTASGACLNLVGTAVGGGRVLRFLFQWICDGLASTQWNKIDAATLALGSLLETSETCDERLLPLLSQIAKCLETNASTSVRDTAAWTLGRFCETQIKLLLANERELTLLLSAFITVLKQAVDDTPNKVALRCCWGVHNFFLNIEPSLSEKPVQSIVAKFGPPLLTLLAQISQKTSVDEDPSNLYMSVAQAIETIINVIPLDDDATRTLVGDLHRKALEGAVNNFGKCTADFGDEYMQFVESQLNILLATVKRKELNAFHEPTFIELVKLTTQSLSRPELHETLCLTLGPLVNEMSQKIEPYGKELVHYALAALQMKSQNLPVAAASLIGDVTRALGSAFVPFADETMATLLRLLQDSTLPREIKPALISCIGDVALAINDSFERYLQTVLHLLTQAVSALRSFPSEDLLDDYPNKLKEAVIEAYSAIISAFRSTGKLNASQLQTPIALLSTLAPSNVLTDSILSGAIGLLGDIVQCLGSSAETLVDAHREGLEALAAEAQRSNPQVRSTASWAMSILAKAGITLGCSSTAGEAVAGEPNHESEKKD
jgi:importin subunit beta-1